MESSTILFAFALTLFAGLSTGIGSTIGLLAKRTNTAFLAASLGFSAGVMLYVSFVEMLTGSRESLVTEMGETAGNWVCVASFFGGILLIGLIDRIIPDFQNPHEMRDVEDLNREISPEKKKHLLRMGVLTALAIGIHNFPEGLATFVAALEEPALGISIAIAIAIHNIPEGIAVSVPVYHATGSRKKAFMWSFISGIAEPLGALIGFAFLMNHFNELTLGIIFALVAGIMVFISLDELLPAAEKYGKHHIAIYGLVAGMAVMALSLIFL